MRTPWRHQAEWRPEARRTKRFLKEGFMPKYVVEREIPGAGNLAPEELKAISQKSCSVIRKMGPEIQWLESFVTGDKIYCVYVAPSAEAIRQHATQGGFPANRIEEVKRMIDPTTAE
jgi:Nickel responsive protein SCO4226-like